MSKPINRRTFINQTAIGSVGLIGAFRMDGASLLNLSGSASPLYALSSKLMDEWLAALLKLQVLDKARTDDYGGIYCPSDKLVHGRCGDTIYPLMYMADKTKDSKYMDSAMLLYRWMERRVSQPDGSWLNEPVKGSWQGTTVFSVIALAETLKNHGSMLDNQFKAQVTDRIKKAGDYIYDKFSLDYGNINYPITASYGLSLLGTLLDMPKFKEKGKEFAHSALKFITPKDGLLYGEGDPLYQSSKKGCFSVDLGYNVEESLPSLIMYGLLNKDEEVLGAVTRSMQTHMEFMLPDGGWDNSWGTRNYKWTYWGSRTSDGCQTAYALMADRDPRFYKAALKNTQLLQQNTTNGLLYGGPHYASHRLAPCVHHTFSHIKSLTTILDYGDAKNKIDISKVQLPREQIYGSRFFSDIQTWLIAKGPYKATITGYDREYKKTKNGHATGGALTMLWHEKTGPIFSGSMNEYQLFEAGNMQVDTDPFTMSLTPHIELALGELLYMNISDLNAQITVEEQGEQLIVSTTSKLVDKNQQNPAGGEINCRVSYIFTPNKVTLKFGYDKSAYDGKIRVLFPVIAKSTEKVHRVNDNIFQIKKEKADIRVTANQAIVRLPTTNGRIFNPVPGLEAIPLKVDGNDAEIVVEVL